MLDDMKLAVREALISTRAVAMCPFHPEVTIRIGDDAAETHASYLLFQRQMGTQHEVKFFNASC